MSRTTLLALLGGVFTVSVGYGFILPILPFLAEQLAATTDYAAISRHTGLLTGVYMMALFLFSPYADIGRFPIEATNVERHRSPHAPL